MRGVEHRRVDRGLQVEPEHRVGEEELQRPLVLLVAAGRPEGEHGPVLVARQRGGERGARPPAAHQRRRQPVLEPEHLRPRAQAEPEPGQRRRALQPAAAGRGGHEVAPAVGDVEMAGVAARRLADARRGRRARAHGGQPPAARAQLQRGARADQRRAARRRTRARAGAPAARRRPRRTPRDRRRRASRPRAPRARAPHPGTARASSISASCCRKTGPWPHGPVLNTVQPRKSSPTGSSQVAANAARSSPASTPAWALPELSTAGSATAATIASATQPRYQASRAASMRASRVAPPERVSRS